MKACLDLATLKNSSLRYRSGSNEKRASPDSKKFPLQGQIYLCHAVQTVCKAPSRVYISGLVTMANRRQRSARESADESGGHDLWTEGKELRGKIKGIGLGDPTDKKNQAGYDIGVHKLLSNGGGGDMFTKAGNHMGAKTSCN